MIEHVAVVGAGTMGRQIALQTARSGLPVTLYDLNPNILEQARQAHQDIVDEWTNKGNIAVNDAVAVFERLQYDTSLSRAAGNVDLAIEVVPERIDLKRTVFTQLDEHCPNHAIIATNSSSIRVSLLEDSTKRPEQVANLHFYIPVWDHPMVEIGGGSRTSAETLDALTVFARRIGMLPLRVRKESTGFIFNRVWRAIKKETLRVVDQGIA